MNLELMTLSEIILLLYYIFSYYMELNFHYRCCFRNVCFEFLSVRIKFHLSGYVFLNLRAVREVCES
jgi:hypothetical protein